jgi:hypothetical protein
MCGLREEGLWVVAITGSAVVVDAPNSEKKPLGQPPLAHRLCMHATIGDSERRLTVPPQNGSSAAHSPSSEATHWRADS